MGGDENQPGAVGSQFFDSLKDLNKQFQEEIERLNGEKAEYEEKIIRFQEEIQCLKRNQVQLQERNAQLAKENMRQETREKLKTDIHQHWSSFVEKIRAEHLADITILTESNQRLTAENEKLCSKKQKLEEDVKQNEMLTEQLDKEIQSWKKSEKEAQKKTKTLQKEVKKLMDERNKLKHELNENNKMVQGRVDRMLFKNMKLSDNVNHLTETNKMLQGEMDKMLSEKKVSSQELKTLTETNKMLQVQVDKFVYENQKLSKDMEKLTESNKMRQGEVDKFLFENQILSYDMDTLRAKYKQEKMDFAKEIENLNENIQILSNDKSTAENIAQKRLRDIKRLKGELQIKNENINCLKIDKKDLRQKLGKIANIIDNSGSTELEEELFDNNSEINELSDENRPTRLAEKFSILYDKDWNEAFKLVAINDEQQKIEFMLNILKRASNLCHDSVRDHMTAIKDSFVTLCIRDSAKEETVVENIDSKTSIQTVQTPFYTKLNTDFETLAKSQKTTILQIKQVFEHKLSEKFLEICTDMIVKDFGIKEQEIVVKYVKNCMKICWLMCRHEPPVHIHFPEIKGPQPYDTRMFKPYTQTKTGNYLDFVVWPAVYLYENGPILAKGVAEGRQSKYRHIPFAFAKQKK